MTENKKYELTDETKEWCAHTLHRIRALKDFGFVKAGELGGWIESERNLSQSGDCWIYDNATVCGYATIRDNAKVCDNATIRDNAKVYRYATIRDNATVCGYAAVYGNATIRDTETVCDDTDYAVVQGFGREQRTTIFYRLKDGEIGVSCGCFHGTIKQFRDRVKETHGDNKYAQEYLMISDLMELHFGEGNNNEQLD